MLLGPEAPSGMQSLLSSLGPACPPRTYLCLIQDGTWQVLRGGAPCVGPSTWGYGHSLPAHSLRQRSSGTQQPLGWGFALWGAGSSDHEVLPFSPPACYPFPGQQGTKAAPHNIIVLLPDSQSLLTQHGSLPTPQRPSYMTGLQTGGGGPSALHCPGCPGSACPVDSQRGSGSSAEPLGV